MATEGCNDDCVDSPRAYAGLNSSTEFRRPHNPGGREADALFLPSQRAMTPFAESADRRLEAKARANGARLRHFRLGACGALYRFIAT